MAAAIGSAASWWATDAHYTKKILSDRIKQQEAYAAQIKKQTERTEHYKTISEKYYADYENAVNSEPVVVTKRLYIKAKCPVPTPANPSGIMGNGTEYVRAELHAETVARITAVTHRAEQDVKQCRAQLHSLQDKIRTHNNAQ